MMYDIIIVGAGCAGLTAALYAARDGRSVLVLDGEGVGGQINFAPHVENYPAIKDISGMAFSDALYEQATAFGAKLDFARAEEIEKTESGFQVKTDAGSLLLCKSVVLACGSKHRRLGLPREDEFSGKGVSYCAICDGAFYKGRSVAVVGGGSAALQSAIMLAGICREVTLIHRRADFRGETVLAARAAAAQIITLCLESRVVALLGGDRLTGISVENNGGQKSDLSVDCLFVSVGQEPDNARFEGLVTLQNGYIAAGEDCQTSCSGIFAAGDCRTKAVRQLTTAAADGTVAGLAASRWAAEQVG